MKVPLSCTEYERIGLGGPLNLCDAHARQPLSPAQQRIVGDFGAFFERAQREGYPELAAKFVQLFFRAANQVPQLPVEEILLSYSASCATDMVSQICMEHGFTVGLVEPCFDNISSYLRRRQVALVPLPEHGLFEHADPGDHPIDVLWLVSPNNPTGACLTEDAFRLLARRCRERGILLVADFCFRFFSDLASSFDQYTVLVEEDTSFIAIEDTGKTWPTADIKCGITTASRDWLAHLYAKHDDLLLSLSPFVLLVLTAFVQDAIDHGMEEAVRRTARTNRATLLSHLSSLSWLRDSGACQAFPVLWLEILHGGHDSEDLYEALRETGHHVLPGTNFFWHDRQKGKRFLRMALNRDPELVDSAARSITARLGSLP
jgi:aspartate/methionine/tyrosine aminotransferase